MKLSLLSGECTTDEQNVIRHACGYVAMRLLQQHKHVPGDKAATFVECLSHMAVEGPEDSLLSYTQEWVQKINRGVSLKLMMEATYFSLQLR